MNGDTNQYGAYVANLGTLPAYPAAISAVTQLVAGNPNSLGTVGLPNSFAFDVIGQQDYFTVNGTTWTAVGGGGGGGQQVFQGASDPVSPPLNPALPALYSNTTTGVQWTWVVSQQAWQ